MATNIVAFKDAPVPAHISKAIGAGVENIDEKLNIPQLSFRGKVWRQVIDGEERPLLNKDDEPVSTVHVVVLNHNKARSRAFYEGKFQEGKSTPPTCWSNDGETPDPSIKEPVARTCAKCPNSVKGSKITENGHETTLCAPYKRLAVVPLSDLSCTPMLLKLAQTSMWDKNNEENEKKGYYAWDQYMDMLRKQGAVHTGLVATKIRFDSRTAYPKLVFAASRWLEDEELKQVKPLFDSDDVMKLLNASEAAAANRKYRTEADPDSDEDEEEEAPAPKKAKAKEEAQPKKAKAKPEPEEEEEDEPPAPKKAKAKPAPEPEEEEEEEEEAPAPKAKAKGKPAPVEEEDEEEEAPAPKKGKAKPAPEPEEEEEEEEEAPAPKKAKAKEEAQPKKAKAKPEPEEEEEEEEKPAPKKAKGKPAADNGLADLVEEFDD